MRIDIINIKNFRSLEDVYLRINELEKCVVLVGENNVGKTNIFLALDLFFSHSAQKAPKEVFKNREKDIEIIIRFVFLTDTEKKLHEQNLLRINKDSVVEESIIARLIVHPSSQTGKRLRYFFAQKKSNNKDASINLSEYNGVFDGITDDLHWGNPFGAGNVTEGYLPKFFYLPAIDDVNNYLILKKEGYLGELIGNIIEKITGEDTAVQKIKEGLKDIGNIETIKEFNTNVSEKIKELFDSGDFQFKIGEPDFIKVLQSAYETTLTDEVETGPKLKGEGMQRALIFAILQVYANLIRKKLVANQVSRSLIFAIEEPELYMHPQKQFILNSILETICKTDQVLFTTHSPYLIRITDYKNYARIIKQNGNTQIIQCFNDIYLKYNTIFNNDPSKEDFDLLIRFNSEISRIFFAKKVIVVEGQDDRSFFEAMISKINVEKSIEKLTSILNCGGKGEIPPILCLLNEFRIPYLVVYDKDNANNQENSNIENIVLQSKGCGTSFPMDPKLETFLKNHQALRGVDWLKYFRNSKKKDHFISPFHAYKFISEVNIEKIPNDIKEKIDSFLL